MVKRINQITKSNKGMKTALLIGGIFVFFLVISAIVMIVFGAILAGPGMPVLGSGNVAVLDIKGPITVEKSGGFLSGSVAASEILVPMIKELNDDENIKAVIINMNSPGGSPVGSDEIAVALKELDKPTVTVIREVGASGGYWIASATDMIFANRMSITGSIGVIASYLEFDGLLADYNITNRRLTAGKYKDLGSPLKAMTQEEQDIYQTLLDELHEEFISTVSENRNIPLSETRKLANGLFYSGRQAVKLGLVNKLGGMDDAKEYLEDILDEEVEFAYYQSSGGLLSGIGMNSQSISYNIGKGIGASLINEKSSTLSIRT